MRARRTPVTAPTAPPRRPRFPRGAAFGRAPVAVRPNIGIVAVATVFAVVAATIVTVVSIVDIDTATGAAARASAPPRLRPAAAPNGLRAFQVQDVPDAILFTDGTDPVDLFTILPDGTGRRSLTAGVGVPSDKFTERLPDWSPDGAQVAFVASRSDGPVQADEAIWVLAKDEAGAPIRIPLTFGPYDTDPDWSPDGSRIAFSSILERGNPGQISSISIVVPGSADQQLLLTPLASPYAYIEQPRWSPDGRRIVFVVTVISDKGPSAPNQGGELYIVNADGSGARRLLARSGWWDANPAWSPDGRLIAFDSYPLWAAGTPMPRGGGVWLLDPATGQAGLVVPNDDVFQASTPKWSPDGRQLVVEGPWEDDVSRLFVLDIAAPTPRAVLTTGREPDWARRPLLPSPTPVPTTDGPTPTDGPSPAVSPTPSPSAEPATPTPPPIPGLTPFPTLHPFPTLPPREPTLPPIAPTWPLPSATHTPRPTPTASPSATSTPLSTATATATSAPTTAPGGRIFLPLNLSAFALVEPAATPTADGAPTPAR